MKALLATLLLATCSLAQTSAPAAPTVAQLVGSWRLVSVEDTLKDGTVKPEDRFGPHPLVRTGGSSPGYIPAATASIAGKSRLDFDG